MNLLKLKEKVLNGYKISKEEAIELYSEDVDELSKAADEIRLKFRADSFDLCTIVNAKSGKCSEDCKFCAQSVYYNTNVKTYPLLDAGTIVKDAVKQYNQGILRYSIVTSGRKLTDEEVLQEAEIIKKIVAACDIKVCVSNGLLSYENFKILKDAGASRVHNNLESSPDYFKEVCTTHTSEDKINAIKAAKAAGLEICSGGIIGLGESEEDRINMALKLREINVKSVPVNVLNPIPNTPFGNNPVLSEDEVRKTIAIFRFILPDAFIRLAGGRALFEDKGKSIFKSGSNSAISGDMLTTSGISTKSDLEILKDLNFTPRVISLI